MTNAHTRGRSDRSPFERGEEWQTCSHLGASPTSNLASSELEREFDMKPTTFAAGARVHVHRKPTS